MEDKKFVIAGGSGFLGVSLAHYLADRGAAVVILARHVPKVAGLWRHEPWDGRTLGAWRDELDGAAGLVNLAGRSVNCVKTPDHQDEILRSRVESTRILGEALRAIERLPPVWLQPTRRDRGFISLRRVSLQPPPADIGRSHRCWVGHFYSVESVGGDQAPARPRRYRRTGLVTRCGRQWGKLVSRMESRFRPQGYQPFADQVKFMQTFEIKPKIGVGPVRFGMTRAEVREHLGPPEDGDADREWYLEDMAIDFDSSGKVAFIELAESQNFRALLRGACLHEMHADDAVAHVQSIAPYDADDPELGYSYVFPELQLSLWRPVIPDDEQNADDPTGRRFEAVGVGGEGYFDT